MKPLPKLCSKCKEIKLLEDFHIDRTRRDGRLPYCKACQNDLCRDYYHRNKGRSLDYNKKWREEHPERVKARDRAYNKEWRKEHPERVATLAKKWKENPKNALSQRIGSRMWHSLKGKKGKRHWETLVGYMLKDLMTHLEKLFKPGMTFENYGKWHIDHKIPISAFSFTKPEDSDFKKCWALSNLQPLWAEENLKKGSKY